MISAAVAFEIVLVIHGSSRLLVGRGHRDVLAKRVHRTCHTGQVHLSGGGSMIGALILGLVAGALARLVIPNDAFEHLEGWKSWLATIVLGLVGAFVGWLIFTGLFGIGDTDVFDLGGLIGAVIGSILVLLAVGWFLRRTRRISRPSR